MINNEKDYCRYERIDELDSNDKLRLKLFINNHPMLFNNKKYHELDGFNSIEAVLTIKEHYKLNDRCGYITLMLDIQYFTLPINSQKYSVYFMWDMMVKYNGEMEKVTEYDRRRWKIKEVLK
jgi:hypothetical protein